MAKCNIEAIEKAIEIMGGVKWLAAHTDSSYQSILDWRKGRTGITIQKAFKIQEATEGQVTVRDILPDLPWGDI